MSDGRMSFADHLEELRMRIVRAGFAALLGMIVAWNFRQQLFAWLLRPLEIAWFCRARGHCTTRGVFDWMLHPHVFRATRRGALAAMAARGGGFPLDPQVHFPDPTAAFVSYLKLAAIGGFVLALPVVFYQLWSFIAPGLYPREKRLVLPFVFFSTLFFVAGALFGYHFVFPVGYEFMLEFGGEVVGTNVKVIPTIMMDEYLAFTSQMLLAFGVVFLLPLFVFFLSLAQLVTWQQLLKFGRYFTVIAFILAAVLTPSPDVYSQVMLALPLVGLYFVAVGLAFLFGPKKARQWRSAGPPEGDETTLAPTKPKADHVMSDEEVARHKAARDAKIRRWEDEQRDAKIRAAKEKQQRGG
jgi:sec-independent protein translocase protein TatC